MRPNISLKHDRNAENAILWSRDDGTSIFGEIYSLMLGITAGARKKGSQVFGGWTTSKV
jgi:hypothetical protein